MYRINSVIELVFLDKTHNLNNYFSGSAATYAVSAAPTKTIPQSSSGWYRMTYPMTATLPIAQDEKGTCQITTQNQETLKVPFFIDYYSACFFEYFLIFHFFCFKLKELCAYNFHLKILESVHQIFLVGITHQLKDLRKNNFSRRTYGKNN